MRNECCGATAGDGLLCPDCPYHARRPNFCPVPAHPSPPNMPDNRPQWPADHPVQTPRRTPRRG